MPKRILIVEDNLEITEALAEAVRSFGHLPYGAANGQEALDLLLGPGDRPSLIILDLMMPVMNGWEFRERQLKSPELAAIPVVLLSADRNVEDEARWLGASGCLKKPLELDDLAALVRKFCGA